MDNCMDAKTKALKEYGTLNSRSKCVTDQLFAKSEFFDPRDMVLVKYEMLRHVKVDGWSVTKAAEAFGFSRVAFYQAKAAFERNGIPGLIPKQRGPKHAHKLSDTVLSFIDQQLFHDKTISVTALVTMVRKRFKFSIHPRSIERALNRRQKKGQ
jgi:transposase